MEGENASRKADADIAPEGPRLLSKKHLAQQKTDRGGTGGKKTGKVGGRTFRGSRAILHPPLQTKKLRN